MSTGVEVRRVRRSEAGALTRISFEAKRHWGYDESLIALWADALTASADTFERCEVLGAYRDGALIGWCALAHGVDASEIDHCWVRPAEMGRGIGRRLVETALARVRASERVVVASDPNAEGFYVRLGFVRVGDVASRPPGRRLPLLERSGAGAP